MAKALECCIDAAYLAVSGKDQSSDCVCVYGMFSEPSKEDFVLCKLPVHSTMVCLHSLNSIPTRMRSGQVVPLL